MFRLEIDPYLAWLFISCLVIIIGVSAVFVFLFKIGAMKFNREWGYLKAHLKYRPKPPPRNYR
jgi:hypothetical protein